MILPERVALIHFVSDQVEQNLLPILALRPARVIQIATERMEAKAEHLGRVVHSMCPEIEVVIQNASSMPESLEIQKLLQTSIEKVKADGLRPVLNLTGGTKLMTIGAYAAAQTAQCSGIYMDMKQFPDKKWVSVKLLPPFDLPDLNEGVRLLTVEFLLQAHGNNPDDLKFEKAPSPELVAVADALATFWGRDTAGIKKWSSELREHVYQGKRNPPDKPSQVDALLKRPIPVSSSEYVERVLTSAVAAGLLYQEGLDHFWVADPKHPSTLKRVVNLFTGIWYEHFVSSRLPATHPDLFDVQCGVSAKETGESDFGEVDFVAVSRLNPGLVFISCKMTPPKLEHVEAFRERATRLGGSRATAILRVHHAEREQRAERLLRWGKALNVGVEFEPE